MHPTSTARPDRAAPAWLQQQVYAPRRQRTLDLVHHAVEALATAQRAVARARQRYRRWTKGLFIERLLAVERAYAEQEDRWLRVNDELLAWQLRAAAAPPSRVIVRADSIAIGGPHHGDESPVAHHGD